MSTLVLHQLAPSPNNVKVRIALGFKGVPCDLVSILPDDRDEIVRLSGQPRTPVLVDGDRVVYDSHAILRYLDANVRREPRLFSADYAEQGAIEQWELWARGPHGLGEPVGAMFGQAFLGDADPEVVRRANEVLAERLARVEETLADRPYLMGEHLTAADATVAAFVQVGMVAPDEENVAVIRFFAEHLHVPAGLERTRDWVRRVVAHDVAPVYRPL